MENGKYSDIKLPNGHACEGSFTLNFHETLLVNGIGSEYELIHCLCCGCRWEEHPTSCHNHKSKQKCISLRNLLKNTPEACRLFLLAIKDGFDKTLVNVDE